MNDGLADNCQNNANQFTGIFMRYLMDAADTTRDPHHRASASHQAATIWTSDRDADNSLGKRWSGADNAAFPNARDWRTQASALSALIAVIPTRRGH